MSKSPVPLSKGRIVHYVIKEAQVGLKKYAEPDGVLPAMITGFSTDEKGGDIAKLSANYGPGNAYLEDIPYSETNEPGTFHWPPKV